MFWLWAVLSLICTASHDYVMAAIALAFASWDGYIGYGRSK